MSMLRYAGVGSRKTPEKYLEYIRYIGEYLYKKGWHLRTGGAQGADASFAAHVPDKNKTIFLPWNNFNGHTTGVVIPEKNFKKYSQVLPLYHPSAKYLKRGAKLLHYRNLAIVLGLNLDVPVNAIICYTDKGKIEGGTATAIRIGLNTVQLGFKQNIPVYNLAIMDPDLILENMLFNSKEPSWID